MKPSRCHSKQISLSSLLFLIPYLLIFHGSISTANTLVLNRLNSNCTGNAYKAGSTFEANLNTLFTSLISKSEFSNSSTETAGNGTDLAFALFLCRADISHKYCQGCIQKAVTDILQNCSRTRQGAIWFDFCELRYSDHNFFGVMDATGFELVNSEKINSTEPLEMMSKLVQLAPYQPSMSASSTSVTDSLFGQAQCTTDLSSDDCKKCLETIFAQIKSCCGDHKGWHYLSYSCSIRYEAYSFLFGQGQEDSLLKFQCKGEKYAANGTYQTNLETLLSYLNSKSLLSNSNTDSVGNEPDRVYGLFLCQGDLPSIDCLNCTKTATSQILWSCPRARQAIIWYDNCHVRYADYNFIGVMDAIGFPLKNSIEETNSSEPLKMVSELVKVAPYQRPLMFATNATVNRSLFGLAQCTVDLSSAECGECLKTILANVTTCCSQSNGWRYLSPSCWVRYEAYSFLRPPSPPLDVDRGGRQKKSKIVVISVVSLIIAMTLLCSAFFLWRRGSQRVTGSKSAKLDDVLPTENMELPLMDLVMVQASTNYFSDEYKLGEGGFGPVYRGVLPDGREIAVKRLSTTSGQGSIEFKNEVRLIAKLQHRNLIRLLGCCMEREEMLLIYEYLPNGSLDAFLFGARNRSHLDWRRRLHIVEGVARGLLYLHEDSRLKVIHRDLKASNVLLDSEMNAKISDFGMATIFEGENNDVDEAMRVVGTYGYMAPEYALHGTCSVKSDVFSFGVLLLEILSGQRNGSKFFQQHGQTLLKYAWKLWIGDRAIELMDPSLEDSYSTNEASRCIHVALLCIQDDADKRPTMSLVVLMLRSEQMALPEPGEPPSYQRRKVSVLDLSLTNTGVSASKTYSVNEVTVTDTEPR